MCSQRRFFVLRFILIAMFFVAAQSETQADEEVQFTQKFNGKIAEATLVSMCPDSGIINDLGTWQKLWVAWRPNELVHNVDFENQLVLVNTANGPNMLIANSLMLDGQGELKYEAGSTRMAGPGFGYLIMIIPKSGIVSVNGSPVDGKPEFTKPAAKPEVPAPKPTTVPAVADTRPVGEESVTVEVVGGIRLDINSVAGMSNNLIAADNIVWELDFQDNRLLLTSARNVGTSLARVKGILTMTRDEMARNRWIIKVDSIENLNQQPPPRIEPETTDAVAEVETPEIPAAVAPNIRLPSPVMETEDPAALNAFTQITIKTSDGQTQTISNDGQVVYESTAKDLRNEWILQPQTVWKFHKFVASTDWAAIDGINRADNPKKDELAYTISIETGRSVKRIFIDASIVAKNPTMREFFGLVGDAVADRQ